jgi:hypothetical protein
MSGVDFAFRVQARPTRPLLVDETLVEHTFDILSMREAYFESKDEYLIYVFIETCFVSHDTLGCGSTSGSSQGRRPDLVG